MFQSRYRIIWNVIVSDLQVDVAPRIPLNDDTRILMISDSHKGKGVFPPDEFAANSGLYVSVLRAHQFDGFDLLDLGDDADEWENPWQQIWAQYDHTFRLARSMYVHDDQGEPVKILGNHDRFVEFNREALETMYGGVHLAKAVWIGDQVFAAHGYRGDFWCDHNWKTTRWLCEKLWVPWQMITHISSEPETSPLPSKNNKRRVKWEQHLMNVCCELDLIGCFGHTHRSYNTEHYWNCGSCLKVNAIQGLRIIGFKLQRVVWIREGNGVNENILTERTLPQPLAQGSRAYKFYRDTIKENRK